jgi:hypothetical protein
MANFDEKILWTVFMRTPAEETQLLNHAKAAGATAVAVRTSNLILPAAIGRFHAAGLKVHGWRWPACRPVSTPPHYFAPKQADYVAKTLIPAGLDGYFADIESENDKKANDWDDASFGPLATQFCATIKSAAPAGFVFALTAGAPQPFNNPHIPWAPFVAASDYLLPQTYWRRRLNGTSQNINGGTPLKAIAVGDKRWAPIAAGKKLVPMIGELDTVSAAEIAAFGAALVARGERRLHVYTDTGAVSPAALSAVKAL